MDRVDHLFSPIRRLRHCLSPALDLPLLSCPRRSCLVFPLPFVAKALPVPCASAAFVSKAVPFLADLQGEEVREGCRSLLSGSTLMSLQWKVKGKAVEGQGRAVKNAREEQWKVEGRQCLEIESGHVEHCLYLEPSEPLLSSA